MSLSGDERVARGLAAQLAGWRARLEAGERRVGWKIGFNFPAVQRRLGISAPVIGSLSSGSLVDPGATLPIADARNPVVEPEIAIHISADVDGGADRDAAAAAIGALGAAIEIVDFDPDLTELDAILAGNVFHRAVALGPSRPGPQQGPLEFAGARIARNGEIAQQAGAGASPDLAWTVAHVAGLLAAHGETLRAGDVIISGTLTAVVPVEPGDRVEVAVEPLGVIELEFAA